MNEKLLPYLIAFAGAFVLTFVLTPVVRELCRAFGMVDKPDSRRINKTPVPRGGGLAIVIGLTVSYSVFVWLTEAPPLVGVSTPVFVKMTFISLAIAALGLADDRFSLAPKVKLFGQVVCAFLVWRWAGLGFADIWPALPTWVDCGLTVFWIVGAVNAFNLIDGLDGLATGLALIATIGMAGGVFFVGAPSSTLLYIAFAGSLLAFLRYNYHPASVFLGDCGSMFIGFMLATLPLESHVPNSFLVSVGVPLLAMGVPIFDTALAILRRSLRRLIGTGRAGAGRVMTADTDHLHHRLLRRAGFNQRKAAWMLYLLAAGGVAVGFVAMALESRSGGLWLGAIALASVVIFKDATVEIFDAAQLLNRMAHAQSRNSRRRLAVWTVPFYVLIDLVSLGGACFIAMACLDLKVDHHALRSYVPARVFATFVFLVGMGTYRTVWSRATGSNYVRLVMACVFGSVAGSVFIYYWPTTVPTHLASMTFVYAVVSGGFLLGLRVFRGFVRDLFYAIDCARLRRSSGVSRILVYGAGLRYKAFRRELVRTTAANDRMIVGLLDDDVCLRGRCVGGIRIYGTINDAPEVISRLGVDAVVVSCEVSDDWLKVVKEILAPTGVKVTRFTMGEQLA